LWNSGEWDLLIFTWVQQQSFKVGTQTVAHFVEALALKTRRSRIRFPRGSVEFSMT
jgi:hypothetical protein